jgi:membrane protease YdiL (CAAX protease family)
LLPAGGGQGEPVALGVAGALEKIGGAVGEGKDGGNRPGAGDAFGVLDEFVAVAAAFVGLFDVEAGDFGSVVVRMRVEGNTADDVVIDRHDVVIGEFFDDVLVGAGDEFGAADGAADHAEKFRDVLFAERADEAIGVGVDHGADAFVGEEFVDENALFAAVEDVDPRDAAAAGFGGGEEEGGAGGVGALGEGVGVRGADGVGGRAINEDGFFKEGDDFGDADALGEIDDGRGERAGGGGVDDGGLAALEDVEGFADGVGVGDRGFDACGHDFALEGPIVEVLEVAAEDAEDEFDAEVLEHGEIEQGFGDGGFGEDPGLDEDAEDFAAELRDVLENGAEVTMRGHGGFLAKWRAAARVGVGGDFSRWRRWGDGSMVRAPAMKDPTFMVLLVSVCAALGIFLAGVAWRAVAGRERSVDEALEGGGPVPPALPGSGLELWYYRPLDLVWVGLLCLFFAGLSLAGAWAKERNGERGEKSAAVEQVERLEERVEVDESVSEVEEEAEADGAGEVKEGVEAEEAPAGSMDGMGAGQVLGSIVIQVFLAVLTAMVVVWRVGLARWLGLAWRGWPRVFVIAPAAVVSMWVFSAVVMGLGYVSWLQGLGVETQQDTVKLLKETGDTTVLVLMAVAAVVVAPICEEVVFRGFLYPVARRFAGMWPAVIFSAVVFAVAHSSLVALLPLAVFGVVLAVIYERTQSIWAPIAAHALFNAATVLVQVLIRFEVIPVPAT